MRRFIEKADILIEALPYLRAFRKKTFVIKYGGRAIASDKGTRSVLQDIVFLSSVGILPILVHGGGTYIDERLRAKKMKTSFIEGRRVTNEKVIRVVDQVLTDLNRKLVHEIQQDLKGHAKGLNGKKGLFQIRDVSRELGYVGEVTKVRKRLVQRLLSQPTIPVISPISCGRNGKLYNVNADEAATKLAESLRAEKLVFLTNVNGILRDRHDPGSRIPTVHARDVDALISRGVVDEGMIPKIRAAKHAISKGVKKVHIINGNLPRALLLEIFTDRGIGTEIVK